LQKYIFFGLAEKYSAKNRKIILWRVCGGWDHGAKIGFFFGLEKQWAVVYAVRNPWRLFEG
jgi:hypothetical protein